MPRRKRSTWGSVQKLRPGVYRLRWWDDTSEGRKRLSEVFHGTRKQADRRLAEIRVAVKEVATPTVDHLWQRYVLPRYRADVDTGKMADQTVIVYESFYRNHVRPRWGAVPVGALRPLDLQDWLLTMRHHQGLKALLLLRAVTDKAEMLGILDHDPLTRHFDLNPAERKERKVPNLKELAEIWDICRGLWVEPAFLLCAHSGLRVGEAAAVKIADIEWRTSMVDGAEEVDAVYPVEWQVTQTGKLRPPKTQAGVRMAALASPWAERLHEIVQGLRPDAVWLMDDGASEPTDLPVRRRIQDAWKAAMKGTAWSRLTLQQLRPAWQTYMHWELGVPQDLISPLMGHTKVSTTQVNYDRPGGEQLVAVALQAARRAATE